MRNKKKRSENKRIKKEFKKQEKRDLFYQKYRQIQELQILEEFGSALQGLGNIRRLTSEFASGDIK